MKTSETLGFKGRISLLGQSHLKSILSLICGLALLSFIVLFLTNHVVTLILSLTLVPENLPLNRPFFVFMFYRFHIFTLERTELFWYFLIIVACISISIFWMFLKDIKKAMIMLIRAIKFKGPLRFQSKNSIILVGQLFFAYYFFYVVYWYSLAFLRLYPAPRDLDITPFDLFRYANSPVYEEIYYRIILIGVPLLILSILFGKLSKRDNPLRFIFGGKLRLEILGVVFLMLSSLIFAAAHLNKSVYYFPPILIIGLMFGYLFMVKGVYAAIVLHFSVTYMDMLIFANNSGYVSGIAELFLGVSILARYLLIIFGIVAGPFYFFWYGKSALSFCADRVRDITKALP